MLYCLLAGQPPYAGETLGELLRAKAIGVHYPTGHFNPLIPVELDRIIDRMIAPDPDQRYQDCAELIRALEELALDNGELSFLRDDRARQRPSRSKPRSG
jgi:serine/threonine protein kinase